MSLSKRVGYETLNEYGTEVAYQVSILAFSLPYQGSVVDFRRDEGVASSRLTSGTVLCP